MSLGFYLVCFSITIITLIILFILLLIIGLIINKSNKDNRSISNKINLTDQKEIK
jgi:uncharacterized alpha/beta hydrolase family protein